MVPILAAGEPLVAFVEASCTGCRRPLLQLRVCPSASAPTGGGCDLAARAAPGAVPAGPAAPAAPAAPTTRLRYARALAPGSYRAEVLLLDVDRWGAVRTRAKTEVDVDVR